MVRLDIAAAGPETEARAASVNPEWSMSFDFPTQARHPALRQLYDYWLAKCQAASRLVSRRQIDPAEMKRFLRYVIMFDVERPKGSPRERRYRFRHRLVGTHIVEMFGQDLTGLYVDQTSSAAEYPEVYERLAAIVDRREPVYGVYHAPTPNREFVEYEHLTVPLSSDGKTVDVLLGVRCGITPIVPGRH